MKTQTAWDLWEKVLSRVSVLCHKGNRYHQVMFPTRFALLQDEVWHLKEGME